MGKYKIDKQVNDFAIEYNPDEKSGNQGITKTEYRPQKICPERSRGQFCSVYFDIDSLCYKIQDLGQGVGTFLKCPAAELDEHTPGLLLKNDSIVQVGANLYCLVSLISR